MKRSRWDILFEDDHLIVINKPARFLTIPDRYDKTKPSLIGTLSLKREKVFVNHRLDKDTSGLILFTKTEEAHKALSIDFENRDLEKHYKTIVHGVPAEEIGLINLPTAPRKGRGKGMVVSDDGKETLTKYRVLENYGRYSSTNRTFNSNFKRFKEERVQVCRTDYRLCIHASSWNGQRSCC